MEEIVLKSNKGNPITTSVLVSEVFGKGHNHVLRDIENLECSQKFRASNFGRSHYSSKQNKKMPLYLMTKDGFSFLVMGYTGSKAAEFKEKFIYAFNNMEEKLRSIERIPDFNNPVEAARAWANAKEKEQIAESKVKALTPKADFAERVIDMDDNHLVDIGQAAKLLKLPKIGRNTFFTKLKEDGIFFQKRNEPKQQYINQGLFQLKEKAIERKNHPPKLVTKVLVTQKGLFWLSKRYGGEFDPGIPALNVS